VTRVQRARLVILALAVGVGVAGCGSAGSIVSPKGSEADRIAGAWWLMFGLACAVYVIVAGLIVYAATRGRRTRSTESRLQPNTFIWVGGVAVPLVILLVLAVVTVHTTAALRKPAADALQIDVAGNDWWWAVHYQAADVTTANEVHIPAGQPIDIRLTSDNVIHSFWVPQLAGKEDVIPGQTNHLRFTADQPGTFRGRCAEFCGLQHAHMDVLVIVQTPGDFGRWLARRQSFVQEPTNEEEARGAVVFQREACAGCHTISGTAAHGTVGPDLSDLGERSTLGAGVLDNTLDNLQSWIDDAPSFKPGIVMPSFRSLAPDDIRALAVYLESLK
jgi:cytochrome c oxidase subunit 2